MQHNIGCKKGMDNYVMPTVIAGGHPGANYAIPHDGSCTCGLDNLQSSLAERELRIAELTALIRELADNEDWVEDTVGIWQDKARAALREDEP